MVYYTCTEKEVFCSTCTIPLHKQGLTERYTHRLFPIMRHGFINLVFIKLRFNLTCLVIICAMSVSVIKTDLVLLEMLKKTE